MSEPDLKTLERAYHNVRTQQEDEWNKLSGKAQAIYKAAWRWAFEHALGEGVEIGLGNLRSIACLKPLSTRELRQGLEELEAGLWILKEENGCYRFETCRVSPRIRP